MGSPTLLSHLNPELGPAPSLSIVDGSGSESVKSLRRKETHVHLLKQSMDLLRFMCANAQVVGGRNISDLITPN